MTCNQTYLLDCSSPFSIENLFRVTPRGAGFTENTSVRQQLGIPSHLIPFLWLSSQLFSFMGTIHKNREQGKQNRLVYDLGTGF